MHLFQGEELHETALADHWNVALTLRTSASAKFGLDAHPKDTMRWKYFLYKDNDFESKMLGT